MIKNFIKIATAAILLSSCNGGLPQILITKANQNYSSSKPGCMIAMKDATNFNWDKMYLLKIGHRQILLQVI